jgi:hypothetical protein
VEKTFTKAEELINHLKEFAENKIKSAKLNVAEKTSKVVANLVAVIVVVVFVLFFIGYASSALAHVLGEWTGKLYWGQLFVAGLYLLFAILLWSGRERIVRLPVLNALLQQFFIEDDHEKN